MNADFAGTGKRRRMYWFKGKRKKYFAVSDGCTEFGAPVVLYYGQTNDAKRMQKGEGYGFKIYAATGSDSGCV